MKKCLLLLCLISTFCTERPGKQALSDLSQDTSYQVSYAWQKVLDSAAWRKNYNFQLFSIRDTLWTFHPDGNWYAADGIHWTKSALPNGIFNLAFLDYVVFDDAVYGLGYFEGNIEQFVFKPEIRRSRDLNTWELLSRDSNLPKRFFYHPFVFEDKIWIIGGEDQQTRYADIWNSEDGVNWVKQKDNLPFGPRSGSQVVCLKDTLYLLNNDAWSSTDGLNWVRITDQLIKGEDIFGYKATVFDEKIWLLGCNRNGQFSSQVLYSTDAKSWHAQEAPWLPRGGVAAAVHQHKLYMTGGKYGGTPGHPQFRYDNDLWTLSPYPDGSQRPTNPHRQESLGR